MGDTDELRSAISECDRECADEIRTWPERSPDELYFAVSVRDWQVIRAALTVQNESWVDTGKRLSEQSLNRLLDSENPPEVAP